MKEFWKSVLKEELQSLDSKDQFATLNSYRNCGLTITGTVQWNSIRKVFMAICVPIMLLQSMVSLTHGASLPVSEYDSLKSLYDSTDGPNWQWKLPYAKNGNPWNFSQPNANPCTESWQGVTCSSNCRLVDCHIEQLVLTKYNLSGTMPPQIGNLTFLTKLQFTLNQLVGTVPIEISNLKQLQLLYLDHNSFTGTIPPQIGGMTTLTTLYMQQNGFSGPIPPTFGGLTNVQFFFIDKNKLTGKIPPEIGSMEALQYLYLQNNLMTGTIPLTLTTLPNLLYLYLTHNQFTGTIPPELSRLNKTLLALYLELNNFVGTVPPELGCFEKLLNLFFSNNDMHGSIPETMYNITTLREFAVQYNYFTGTVSSKIADMESMKNLFYSNNLFTGTLPPRIGNSKTLDFVYFQNNFFTGTIPVSYGNLTSLHILDLSNNLLTGNFKQNGNILHLKNLTEFMIDNNQLSGNLYDIINSTEHSIIVTFSASMNYFTGQIPTFQNFKNLTKIQLSNNWFTGHIPQLRHLNILNLELSNNLLYGTISYKAFSDEIEYLNVSSNLLSGPLAVFAIDNGGPENMQSLDISRNLFEDTMQKVTFSFMCNLTILRMSDNILKGNVEDLLDPLNQKKLKYLDISSNQFTGSLPSILYNGLSLSSLVAADNCLTGTIPQSVCDNVNMTGLVLDGMGTASACQTKIFPDTSNPAYVLDQSAGTIPGCLFDLTQLQTLHLSGLMLTGSIPEMDQIHQLQYLSLSYNTLTNTIPEKLLQYNNWHELDLSFNRLTGSLSGSADLKLNATLRLENNRLSGNVPSSMLDMTDINILDGNLFECDFDANKLPNNDESKDSYQCGSDYVDASIYVWLAVLGFGTSLFIILIGGVSKAIEKYQLISNAKETGQFLNLNLTTFDKFGVFINRLTKQWMILTIFIMVILLPLYAILKAVSYGTFEDQYGWIISASYLTGIVPTVLLLIAWTILLGLIIYPYSQVKVHKLLANEEMDNDDTPQTIASTARGVSSLLVRVLIVIAIVAAVILANSLYVYGLDQKPESYYIVLMVITLSLFKIAVSIMTMRMSFLSLRAVLALLCFNGIVAPYLAELFVSSNCFYYAVLATAPSVTSTFEVENCQLIINSEQIFGTYAIGQLLGETTTIRCASAPRQFTYDPPFVYSYTCSSSFITNFGYVFILRYIWSIIFLILHIWSRQNNSLISRLGISMPQITPPFRMKASLLSDFAILLTFGVLFPPLALIVFCTMALQIAYCRIQLGDLINRARNDETEKSQLVEISKKFENVEESMTQPLPYLGILAAMFWSFTLFDTLGDDVGATKASSAMVIMCVMPFIWIAGYLVHRRYHFPASGGKSNNNSRIPSAASSSTLHNPLLPDNKRDDIELSNSRDSTSPKPSFRSSLSPIQRDSYTVESNKVYKKPHTPTTKQYLNSFTTVYATTPHERTTKN